LARQQQHHAGRAAHAAHLAHGEPLTRLHRTGGACADGSPARAAQPLPPAGEVDGIDSAPRAARASSSRALPAAGMASRTGVGVAYRLLIAPLPQKSRTQGRVTGSTAVVFAFSSVEQIPGMKRPNRKTAFVYLRSAPDAPEHFTIDGQHRSASSSSSRTQPFGSPGSRAESAKRAASPPIRPSAHAACPRTSGSASSSARTSAGTASGAPQFPSATATLRRNPARFARRIADPRENASHAASSIPMRSTRRNSVPVPVNVPAPAPVPDACRPEPESEPEPESDPFRGRGRAGSSPAPALALALARFSPRTPTRTNFSEFHGQTSWQMSHPNTRFPISGLSSRGIGPRSSIVR